MKILSIDSACDILGACLSWDGGMIEAMMDSGLGHSERLMPMIEQLLANSGIEKREIDLIACMEGPGSFTGLRIGMSAAKGLAFGLGKPFVAVPTLDCQAYGKEYFDGVVVPIIDAKKDRVYSALYLKGQRKSEWLDIGIKDLLAMLEKESSVLFTGPDALMCAESLREGWFIDPLSRSSRAKSLAILGAIQYERSGASPAELSPLYLRKSEAELGIRVGG